MNLTESSSDHLAEHMRGIPFFFRDKVFYTSCQISLSTSSEFSDLIGEMKVPLASLKNFDTEDVPIVPDSVEASVFIGSLLTFHFRASIVSSPASIIFLISCIFCSLSSLWRHLTLSLTLIRLISYLIYLRSPLLLFFSCLRFLKGNSIIVSSSSLMQWMGVSRHLIAHFLAAERLLEVRTP